MIWAANRLTKEQQARQADHGGKWAAETAKTGGNNLGAGLRLVAELLSPPAGRLGCSDSAPERHFPPGPLAAAVAPQMTQRTHSPPRVHANNENCIVFTFIFYRLAVFICSALKSFCLFTEFTTLLDHFITLNRCFFPTERMFSD